MTRWPLVSIIIVNWNGNQVFTDCLASLEKVDYKNYELIVVDNGSSDESEMLPLKYKLPLCNYLLIKNNHNLGFAIANNQGLKKAKGKYILLLNNDTKVSKNFLSKMVAKMQKDPSIGAMQPKIYIMDKPEFLDNAGSFLTKIGFLQHWGYLERDSENFNQEKEVFSVKGACLLTRKEIINKVGLFDDDFMSYFEESDFCWRVWLGGWRVVYFPETFIFHKVGFSSKRQNQIFVNFHSFKNRIASLIKNLEIKNLFTIFIYHLALVSILGLYYLIKLQLNKSQMIWHAIFWNLINLKKTLKKRSQVQNFRKRTDDQLFEYVLRKTSWKEMFIHFGKVEANFK